MKANELMIGDLINAFGVVRKVTSINRLEQPEDDGLLTTMVPGCEFPDSNLSFRPYYAQPIPLTTEILEKNGFDGDREVMQYYFEEDGQRYHFSLRQMYDKDGIPHGYSFFAFNVLTILDYVHELQHALRLCGIEKTIKL